MIDLSIIIVNWNSAKYLDKCIETIVSNSGDLKYEVIVIDNASHDGCDKVVRKFKDIATLIQSDQNLGFAGANNLAVRHSTAPYLLFLNPDTEIIDDTISRMYQFISTRENIGCLGCKVLNTDGTIQISCVQAFPTISNQIFDSSYLQNRFPHWKIWGMKPLFASGDSPSVVDTIAGSCMMISKSTFIKAGLFTEDYFMFAEDRDLCFKVSKAGYTNYVIPSVSIIHHGGGSTKVASTTFSAVLLKDSARKYFLNNRSRLYAYSFSVIIVLCAIARILLMLLAYPCIYIRAGNCDKIRYGLRKWNDIFRWAIGLKKITLPTRQTA